MERAAGGQWHWASSFKFGSCKRSPSAAQAAAGKTENRAGQGSRATASYTSQTPDRKEGTQHAAGDSAGFQVPATRSQCASGLGSEPRIAVARTQHRVRAAVGCVHNGRPGNWSRTCQSAAVQGSSFTGPASVRKEGTQHGQGTVPGFKFQPRGVNAPATRAEGPD